MQVQINPISAAQHYATAATFWENHAKTLQHRLDEAQARIEDLERVQPPVTDPDPAPQPTKA